MPRVSFTENLRKHIECPPVVTGGGSLRTVLDQAFEGNPLLRGYVLDDRGRLRKHMNIFVGQEMVRDRDGLSDPVGEDEDVFIMQALSGG